MEGNPQFGPPAEKTLRRLPDRKSDEKSVSDEAADHQGEAEALARHGRSGDDAAHAVS